MMFGCGCELCMDVGCDVWGLCGLCMDVGCDVWGLCELCIDVGCDVCVWVGVL